MPFSVIIPARFASTRLPGKPLLDIAGKPMLRHVWERSSQSQASAVIIATDDPRIQTAAEAWGAQVCMTRASHASGTDRLQEVAQIQGFADDVLLVNVQGDEPLVPSEVIDQVADNLARATDAAMATLCEPLRDAATLCDSNAVKVVTDAAGYALYFSRAPVPFPRGVDLEDPQVLHAFAADSWQRHIGLYAYRAGFLHRFVSWPQAPSEQIEQLEQLRALHYGERIHVARACREVPPGVDTQSDLDSVRRLAAVAGLREDHVE